MQASASRHPASGLGIDGFDRMQNPIQPMVGLGEPETPTPGTAGDLGHAECARNASPAQPVRPSSVKSIVSFGDLDVSLSCAHSLGETLFKRVFCLICSASARFSWVPANKSHPLSGNQGKAVSLE